MRNTWGPAPGLSAFGDLKGTWSEVTWVWGPNGARPRLGTDLVGNLFWGPTWRSVQAHLRLRTPKDPVHGHPGLCCGLGPLEAGDPMGTQSRGTRT